MNSRESCLLTQGMTKLQPGYGKGSSYWKMLFTLKPLGNSEPEDGTDSSTNTPWSTAWNQAYCAQPWDLGLQFSIRSLVVHRPGLHLSVIELSTRSSECAKNVNNSPISVLITIAILGCILFFTLLSYVWGSFMISQANLKDLEISPVTFSCLTFGGHVHQQPTTPFKAGLQSSWRDITILPAFLLCFQGQPQAVVYVTNLQQWSAAHLTCFLSFLVRNLIALGFCFVFSWNFVIFCYLFRF